MSTSPSNEELLALVDQLDANEKVCLLYTLQAIDRYKSKGWRTRRWREFEKWITDYRSRKAA